MKKRLVILFLSLTLVASMFTGCGNDSQSGSDNNSSTSQENRMSFKLI